MGLHPLTLVVKLIILVTYFFNSMFFYDLIRMTDDREDWMDMIAWHLMRMMMMMMMMMTMMMVYFPALNLSLD